MRRTSNKNLLVQFRKFMDTEIQDIPKSLKIFLKFFCNVNKIFDNLVALKGFRVKANALTKLICMVK